jgi:pimeloyl-ACP methyl ester carboxylesterase
VTCFVGSADGRRLAVQVSGHPAGRPVFLLHGTPGSRVGPFPRGRVLYELGVRLVTFDRPGYGRSDRLALRRVADVAADVEAIANALGLDRFAVLGRSGGGPHALACAALLGGRVTRAAVLVGLAPLPAEGLDWFAGMTDSNVSEYTAATAGRESLLASLGPAARGIKADPTRLVTALSEEMPEADQRVVADAGIRAMLVRNYAEAVRISADGWIDDILAFCSPWGFDPADIGVPVLLWHGEDDVFSPVSHSLWLARRIPGAIVEVESGSAHFDALRVMPDVMSWLIRKTAELRAG